MGKRGPKPKFTDVPCPNEDCEDYGKVNNGNIISNGTYKTKKMGKVHRYYTAKHVEKALHQMLILFHYDLRTNEETVFLALKMIPKGMNLRGYS
jgi:hypothetical protein